MGATTSAKRTAAVHVVFNVVTAIFAFLLLSPIFVWAYQHVDAIHQLDEVLLVAAFHTAFSLLGACIFMPLLPKFEQLIIRLLPEQEPVTTRYLDESLYSVPALAIAAVERALLKSIADMYSVLVRCIQNEIIPSFVNISEYDHSLVKVEQYLKEMSIPQSNIDQQRFIILLRLVVYVRVLKNDLADVSKIEFIQNQSIIYDLAQRFATVLEQNISYLLQQPFSNLPESLVNELTEIVEELKKKQEFVRQQLIEDAANKNIPATYTLELLAAQRWLEHLIVHCSRVAILLSDTTHILVDDEVELAH